MKKIFKILLVLSTIVITAVTCERQESENCHPSIRFSNNSENRVRVNFGFLNSRHTPNYFSALVRMSPVATQEMFIVRSGEQENRSALNIVTDCLEVAFNDISGNLDTIFVFVFDATLIENTPWDIVVRDNLVLRRYHLTLEDLQRLNWRIAYPPTEEMRDIKMYPPFGQ